MNLSSDAVYKLILGAVFCQQKSKHLGDGMPNTKIRGFHCSPFLALNHHLTELPAVRWTNTESFRLEKSNCNKPNKPRLHSTNVDSDYGEAYT